MNSVAKTSRVLGIAFLLQFITSFASGVFIRPALVVNGSISEIMANIGKNAWLMRTNIFIDMLTACGVIFLGAILYLTLRKQNEKIALAGFCFYILEGVLHAVSRVGAFILLRISQEYVTAGQTEYLKLAGSISLNAMDFAGSSLSMLAFCFGGVLFYYLLHKSGIVPRALSLWGLIAVFPCFIGTMFSLFGYKLPFIIYVPYVPFEFVIGIWILVRGVKNLQES